MNGVDQIVMNGYIATKNVTMNERVRSQIDVLSSNAQDPKNGFKRRLWGKIKYEKLGVALSLVQGAAGKTLPLDCTRGARVFHQTADHVSIISTS